MRYWSRSRVTGKKAKKILQGIATRHAEHLSEEAERRVREASMKFMIFYSKLTPTVYTSVEDCGVLLTLRYLTEPQRRRGRMEAIWEDVLRAFADNDDIDFAYPTQRFYLNRHEGKPGNDQASARAVRAAGSRRPQRYI